MRDDGWLCELISMNYNDHPFLNLHTYLVSITPSCARANHFHKKKEEWIAPAAGNIKISLIDTQIGETEIIIPDPTTNDYSIIYIPPGIAHAIKNIGNSEASIVVFSKTPEDKMDTFPFEVDA
jgi:dTDP-4-dehydrorhamnose 3,5-epimerase-like enzyme